MTRGIHRRWFGAAVVTIAVALAASGCLFPVSRTTDDIELLSTTTLEIGTHSVEIDHYRNNAYRCGRSGHFTFLVIEPLDAPGSTAPLWIFLRGGGVGHFLDADPGDGQDDDVEPTYHPSNSVATLDAEPFDTLLAKMGHHVLGGGSVKDTVLARRVLEGTRVLVPSMCDHDLHAGDGTRPHPDNPNLDGTDTVDGLAANMAATDFVTGSTEYPTTHVFVHGVSAGSVGAWALSYAYAQEGIQLNGAILDSFVVTDRLEPLFAAGLTPLNRDAQFDLEAVRDKVGPFTTDPELFPEHAISGEQDFREVPVFSLVGAADQFCAGQLAAVPAALAAGYTDNCRFVFGGLVDAVAQQSDSPHRVTVYEPGGHVLTAHEGLWTDDIEVWLDAILAGDPPHPFA